MYTPSYTTTMARSWASVVGSLPSVALQKPKVVFHPFCADCGHEAEVCRRCSKWAVHEDGLCGSCVSANTPSDSMCIGLIHLANAAPKQPFLCERCRIRRRPIQDGYVEMEDILKGQRVTAEQFFNAVRCADEEADGELIYGRRDVKTMSSAVLHLAYEDVCQDRRPRAFKLALRTWDGTEQELRDAMDSWARELYDEMCRRQ